ncbi:MAG: alpha/beta hydrolase [Parasphingorhabdus sp.]|uniref:alpha/beta hydrolase n=1 Tax=Parasphingorhabdus sp. TaxID=2709688 RepID=UPI003001C750
MRKYLVFSAASIALASMISVAAQARLDRSCRQEIVSMCGMNRDAIRACIKEKRDQLSDNCTTQLRENIRERAGRNQAKEDTISDVAANGELISYGADPLQKLRFYRAAKADAPLIIFIHGGGWKRGDMDNATGSDKVSHYLSEGFAFATINYRLVPQSTVEDQAADIAAATAALQDRMQKLGSGPRHIFLMGHSAGAHLAALTATDLSYFRKAGVNPAALRGVILLDGAAYDVPTQLVTGNRIMQSTYKQAFGSDAQRQKSLSPTYHAATPNAAAFMILHIDRKDAKQQSDKLAENLLKNGTSVAVRAISGKGMTGHREINHNLGKADYPATTIVDSWLAEQLR